MLELEMKLGQLLAFHQIASRHLRYLAIATGRAAEVLVEVETLGLETIITAALDRVRAIEKACLTVLNLPAPSPITVERKV